MRRSFVASALSTVLVLLLSAPVGARAQGLRFEIVPTPPVQAPAVLSAVAALSPTDVWGVGDAGGEALVEHWDGSEWAVVPAPTPGDSSTLLGITALAPDDVWAVGVSHRGPTHSGLIQHWNGSAWSPTLTNVPFDLNDVDARTPTDVWAVGAGPYLTHWDGSTWEVAPHAPIEEGELHQVVVLAPDDAWAVGALEAESSPPHTEALLFHWQGSVWGLVAHPARSLAQEVWAIDAVSPTDIWAVGTQETKAGHRTLALHFDGTEWSVVPARNPGSGPNELLGVVAISSANVWAVGSYVDGGKQHPMAQHWDGSRWRLVPVEEAPQFLPMESLLAVDASRRGNVWAVGLAARSDVEVRPLVERLGRT